MAPALSTLFTIPLGLFIGYKFSGAIAALEMGVKKLDPKDPALDVSTVKTGFGPADAFLKMIVPFFRFAMSDRPTGVYMDGLLQLILPWSFYSAIEGLRPGGLAIHWLYPAMQQLGQFIGIGATTPLFWVPATLNVAKRGALPLTPVTTLGLGLLFAGQAWNMYVSSGLQAKDPAAQTRAMAVFQISPTVAWLFWSLTPFIPPTLPLLSSIPAPPSNIVEYIYYGVAALCFSVHLGTIRKFIRKPELVGDTVSLLTTATARTSPAKAAGHFLAWDFVGMYLSILYFVGVGGTAGEVDWPTVGRVALRSVLVGPGAAVGLEFAGWEGKV